MSIPLAVDNCNRSAYGERMETFGARLAKLRAQRGISQAELARRVGWTSGYVSLIEGNKRLVDALPRHDFMVRLADVLGVGVEDLAGTVGGAASKRLLSDDELFAKIGAGYVADIPHIDDVLVSAGAGSAIPQDIDDTLPQRPKRRHAKQLRTLVVTGRCLEPELRHGDFVVIDRDRAAEPGKLVVAVRDEEEALIKRLVERDGALYLSTNDGRPDTPVDDHVRILGPVVAYQRMLW